MSLEQRIEEKFVEVDQTYLNYFFECELSGGEHPELLEKAHNKLKQALTSIAEEQYTKGWDACEKTEVPRAKEEAREEERKRLHESAQRVSSGRFGISEEGGVYEFVNTEV